MCTFFDFGINEKKVIKIFDKKSKKFSENGPKTVKMSIFFLKNVIFFA